MTELERGLCRSLIVAPSGNRSKISKKNFRNKFPGAFKDGRLSAELLADAYRRQDPSDLELALVVGYNFGFGREHLPVLCRLVVEDWHFTHEWAVSALDKLRDPSAVDALFHATQHVPAHLAFDDARALAVKAIWALRNLGTEPAIEKLAALASAEVPVVSQEAAEQLERLGVKKAF